MAVAVTAASGCSSSAAMAPSACRAVRLPSQTPTSPAPTVSSADGPAQTAALPELDDLRVGGAGPPVPLLGDVRRARPGDVEQGVVVVLGQPGPRPQSGVDGRAPSRRPPGRGGRRGRPRVVAVRSGRWRATTPNPMRSTPRAAKSASHAAYRSS